MYGYTSIKTIKSGLIPYFDRVLYALLAQYIITLSLFLTSMSIFLSKEGPDATITAGLFLNLPLRESIL